jgi:hypothetical protein
MPATIDAPLEKAPVSSDKNEIPRLAAWCILIGQIKLTRIHVFGCFSPGYGSNETDKHLFTMSKDPAASPLGMTQPNLLSFLRRYVVWIGMLTA